MARVHHLEWADRAECLEAIASSYGDCPPREPVPAWWNEFEKWYQEQKKTANKDGVVACTVRTEAFAYDDEEDDDDEEEETGPESGEAGD